MSDMKTLLAGVTLILLLGIAGFLYRNALENPPGLVDGTCTLDAKICPDGTAVGRSGPACEFAQCAPPNTELTQIGIAFVIPEGYVLNPNAPAQDDSQTLVASYERTSTSSPKDIISVRRYPIGAGQTADQVILSRTVQEPSGMNPEDMTAFSPRIVGSRTFLAIVIERFEAQVHSAYYLPREHDVLVFEVVERDVTDWMEPGLIVDNLPQHQILLRMLATLDVAP